MSESDLAATQREITALLDRLDHLYEEAEAAIDAIEDPDEAFKRASAVAGQAREFHDRIASLLRRVRARQAARIQQSESLSLAALADRISVSKARADQFVRLARKE